MTKTISLDFASTVIKTSVGKDSPDSIEFDFANYSPEVLRAALINGFIGALNNIPRSNGTGEEPKTLAQWKKAKEDKVAIWAAGSWSSGRTGERDSMAGAMRDEYLSEQEGRGVSRKEAEATIKSTVKEAFGDKEAATFANFLLAVATNLAKTNNPKAKAEELAEAVKGFHERLEAKYRNKALETIAARKAVKVKVDLTSLLD